MASATNQVQAIIDKSRVVVFSKTYCPYCRETKSTLNSLGAQYALYELDERDDGRDLQDALENISHQRTVPNIYIGQKHIGGNAELQKLHENNKLIPSLKEVGALNAP